MKKLFVGGLSWGTTEESLREFLTEKGYKLEDSEYAVKIVKDRESGRSKGFGFVTFDSEEEAERAQKELDGVEFDGRTLKFDMARESAPGQNGPRRDFRPRN